MTNADSNRPSSKVRRGMAAILALGVIGVAGFVIYRNRPEELAAALAPAPAALPQAEKVASDRGMVHSQIAVIPDGQGAGARSLITMAKPVGPTVYDETLQTDPGIIARELVRQALLIAARDELGMTTRDEVIDGKTPAKPPGKPVMVSSVFRTDGPSRILIRQTGKGKTLFEHVMGAVPNEFGILAMILPVAEERSRNEFPATLKGLGAVGPKNQIKATAPLPPKVEERLQGLSIVDHFAAIRDLHEIMRTDGESPERVGALARAYAVLGVLTEFQWNPGHKVYKARALLYAQRLLARDPGSAWALRNRAFVRSVIGLHQEALDDLAEATKRAGTGADAKPPAWVAPIEAYANQSLGRLASIDGPYTGLARLLRLLAVEFPLMTLHALRAAQDVLEVDEECYRAHDAACRNRGVSVLHVATLAGPEVLSRRLPASLAAIQSLPPTVKAALDANKGEIAINEALESADVGAADRGELSWGVLSYLIRETRFLQVFRRMHFMRMVWSVPADDYWAEAKPYVADHRYVTYLKAFVLPPQENREAMTELANTTDPNELEAHEPELFSDFDRLKTKGERTNFRYAFSHGDAVARDLASAATTQEVRYRVLQSKVLLAVSPHSTLAQTLLIMHAWDEYKDMAAGWEARASDSPLLLDALADHYRGLKQYDHAKSLYRRCLALSPQASVYKSLAQIYKAEKNIDAWRATLEDYLANGEDTGLDKSAVQAEIARYLIDEKRPKEAIPYAEAAAATWSGSGMQSAIDCYEATGEWEKAEGWVQRLSDRYANGSWMRWFLFCKRTGHGDIKAAKAWTDAYLEANKARPDIAIPYSVAHYEWLNGSKQEALKHFTAMNASAPSIWQTIPMLLLTDELGEPARHAEIVKEIREKGKAEAPKTVEILLLVEDAAASGKAPDLAAIDKLLDAMPPESRSFAHFFVGKFLRNRNQAEAGNKYLMLAARSPADTWFREAAWTLLGPETIGKKAVTLERKAD